MQDKLTLLQQCSEFLIALINVPCAVRVASGGDNRIVEMWTTLALEHAADELGRRAPGGLRALLDCAVTQIALLQEVYHQVGHLRGEGLVLGALAVYECALRSVPKELCVGTTRSTTCMAEVPRERLVTREEADTRPLVSPAQKAWLRARREQRMQMATQVTPPLRYGCACVPC